MFSSTSGSNSSPSLYYQQPTQPNPAEYYAAETPKEQEENSSEHAPGKQLPTILVKDDSIAGKPFLKMEDFKHTTVAVNLFTPLTHLVNKWALGKSRIARGFISSLEYFITPLDRAIQLISIPIFAAITHFMGLAKEKSTGLLVAKSIATPLTLPIKMVVKTLGIGVPLLINAIVNLQPYKLITSFTYDRPADYFRFRHSYRPDSDSQLLIKLR